MKNKNKAIMVEFINDNNDWVWYSVYKNCTAKQALESYWYENCSEEVKPEFIENKDGLYLKDTDARAYEIDIIDFKNKK